MERRLIAAIILSVIVASAVLIGVRTIDLSKKAHQIEDLILPVLYENGVKDEDILLREESAWKRRRINGLTITYVFRPNNQLDISSINDDIYEAVKKIKGVSLNKFSYRSEPGEKGVVELDIQMKGEVILSIVFKDIAPTWIKKQLGVLKEEEKIVYKPEDGPYIVLVLDDFGYAKRNLQKLSLVKGKITMAILPATPYTDKACAFAKENDLETILHLPMEPKGQTEALEVNTIKTSMSKKTVEKILAKDLKSVYTAKGVSNHMGSKATSDINTMTIIMKNLKKRGMFFLDSYTGSTSVCDKIAREVDVPYLRRDIFIDNRLDSDYIKKQLGKLENIARSKGKAVGIGHDRSVTIDVLGEVMPEMEKKGIKFITLTDLIKIEEKDKEK